MLRLPQELTDMVVDELSDDLHSLLACNSASRRLRARVRTHLYRAVLIGDNQDESTPLQHLRVSYADSPNPTIAWSFITYLQLALCAERDELWGTLFDRLGRPGCALRSLEDLVLKGDGDDIPSRWLLPLVGALHQCCQSVRYLNLEHCCFWQLSLLAFMVSGFPTLRHLAMPIQIRSDLDAAARRAEHALGTLRSVSIPVTGVKELELAVDLTCLLHEENVKWLLLVDSFFLWDLLSATPDLDDGCRSHVKAIALDTKWEDCGKYNPSPRGHIEQLLDVFPALEFLCVSVRIQESFFATTRAWKSTQIDLAIRTLQTPEVHFGPLKYLSLALSTPAHLALRTLAGARLDDLCDALCAPHAQHIRLVLISVDMYLLASLESISVAASGPSEVQLLGAVAAALGRNNVGRILFIDSFLLPVLCHPPPSLKEEYQRVNAISIEKSSDRPGIEDLIKIFPSLRVLCISVRKDTSYYNTARPWKCSLIDLCRCALAARGGALSHIVVRLDELCDVLCAPHTRHIRLVMVCVIERGQNDTAAQLCNAEMGVKELFEARFSRLTPKRWSSIVTQGAAPTEELEISTGEI
ncbi:hypothetical protein AURDEDRAFT_159514 [Auricularia subglabra TFB-10046 SS5]|nr:hypothetical protein AURDEDRAFT_159514 [Auricularia subglabra TFB-10046 SS5]